MCSQRHQLASDLEDLVRGIAMSESPGIRHDSGVETIGDISIDQLFISELINQLINEFSSRGRRAVPLFEFGKLFRFEMMVDKYFFCFGLPHHFTQFIDPVEA